MAQTQTMWIRQLMHSHVISHTCTRHTHFFSSLFKNDPRMTLTKPTDSQRSRNDVSFYMFQKTKMRTTVKRLANLLASENPRRWHYPHLSISIALCSKRYWKSCTFFVSISTGWSCPTVASLENELKTEMIFFCLHTIQFYCITASQK